MVRTIPSQDEIATMSVRLPGSQALGVPQMKPFGIARKYYRVILGAITPAKRCDFAVPDDWILAEIDMATTTGCNFVILLYEGGDNPICFSANGVRCSRDGPYMPNSIFGGDQEHFLDESACLYGIIRSIHQNQATGNSDLQKWIAEMERSRGDRAPVSENPR